MDNRELTLTDLLADPMTLAVMAADEVDPVALEAALSGLARKLELGRPAERRRVCVGRGRSAVLNFLSIGRASPRSSPSPSPSSAPSP
jgi:hypothetical protein